MAEVKPGNEPNTIVIPDAKVTSKTTPVFGLTGFNMPTPQAAKNAFIIFYSMNASIIAYLGLTKWIPATAVVELVLLFKFIVDPLCYILSKMWGIAPINITNNSKDNG